MAFERCARDKMIDWVTPARRGAAAQSHRAVRGAGGPAVTRSDSVLAGAGRGWCPIAFDGWPSTSTSPRHHWVTTVDGEGCRTMVNASPPRSVRMCTAWRTMRRAWDSAARLPS